MSELLEKAKAHFSAINSEEGLRCLEVPEWGDKNGPAHLYFKPLATLSIKDYSRFVALGSEQTVESFVDMLILRCLDSEGLPVFKTIDRTEMLRHISPIVVCNIITRMNEQDTVLTTIDAKKNS